MELRRAHLRRPQISTHRLRPVDHPERRRRELSCLSMARVTNKVGFTSKSAHSLHLGHKSAEGIKTTMMRLAPSVLHGTMAIQSDQVEVSLPHPQDPLLHTQRGHLKLFRNFGNRRSAAHSTNGFHDHREAVGLARQGIVGKYTLPPPTILTPAQNYRNLLEPIRRRESAPNPRMR